MSVLNERIKELRLRFHLSQEYVARYLGVSRATFTQMENGKRKILAEEIPKLCLLFGVSADTLFGNTEMSPPSIIFARCFEKLSVEDQAEVMNLIRFKELLRRR